MIVVSLEFGWERRDSLYGFSAEKCTPESTNTKIRELFRDSQIILVRYLVTSGESIWDYLFGNEFPKRISITITETVSGCLLVMKKISCRTTFYQKKIFPFVFIGMGIYAMIVGGTGENGHPFFILLFLLIITMIIFAHIQFKVFFLMDEVFDDGDSLLLRNSGKEVRIPLQEIENICYPQKINHYSRLEQVELTLKHPTEFGTEIYFLSAGDDLFSNEANTDIPDLMERISQAKTEQNQRERDRIID